MVKANLISLCPSLIEGEWKLKELNISTDTRELENVNCFIALYGENFDGYSFIDKAFEAGVELVIFKEVDG